MSLFEKVADTLEEVKTITTGNTLRKSRLRHTSTPLTDTIQQVEAETRGDILSDLDGNALVDKWLKT